MSSPQKKQYKITFPEIPREEWEYLDQRIQWQDRAAHNSIFLRFIPMVRSKAGDLARQYRMRPDELEDLISVGHVELARSIWNWRIEKGGFATYVGTNLDFVLPTYLRKNETVSRKDEFWREPKIYVSSFETPVGIGEETSRTLGDTLEDTTSLRPDQCMEFAENVEEVMADIRYKLDRVHDRLKHLKQHVQEIGSWSERNKKVFLTVFGYLDETEEWGKQKTNQFVADLFKISRERVRQIIESTWSRVSTAYPREDFERDRKTFFELKEIVTT